MASRSTPCGGLVFAHELGHNMGLGPRQVSARSSTNRIALWLCKPANVRARRTWVRPLAHNHGLRHTVWGSCRILLRTGLDTSPTQRITTMAIRWAFRPTTHRRAWTVLPTLWELSTTDVRSRRTSDRAQPSPSPRAVHLTLSPYWLSENGGVSKVTATLHRPSSADTTVTVSASPSDAVTLSGSRTLTIPAGRTVSVGKRDDHKG